MISSWRPICSIGMRCSFLYCPISRDTLIRLFSTSSSSLSISSICWRRMARLSVVTVESRCTRVLSIKFNTSGVTCWSLSLHAQSGLQWLSIIRPSNPMSRACCDNGATSSLFPPMWLGSHIKGRSGNRRRSSIGMCH